MTVKRSTTISYYHSPRGAAFAVLRKGGKHRLFQPSGSYRAAPAKSRLLLGEQVLKYIAQSKAHEWSPVVLSEGATVRRADELLGYESYDAFLRDGPVMVEISLLGDSLEYLPTERTRHGFMNESQFDSEPFEIPLSSQPEHHADALVATAEESF